MLSNRIPENAPQQEPPEQGDSQQPEPPIDWEREYQHDLMLRREGFGFDWREWR